MRHIKYLIMDVDGTLTDGKIYFSDSGELMKAFNIKDGYGIKNILLSYNIIPIIITGRTSKLVELRCKELNIKNVYQGIENKLAKMMEIVQNLKFVAYIGDDMNDYDCMEKVKLSGGIIGCPYDADDKIKQISHYVSNKCGGNGAVRDFIDWLISNEK